jgi:FixJ family two-component response regulator
LKAEQKHAARAPVIVIDDDALFRRSLVRLLEEHGHQPKGYASFDHFEASETIPLEGCVVLDLNLPHRNGLEIQNKLAAIAPTLCVVFLTGFGQVASSVRAMKNGAVDFLEKPIEDVVLLQAVRRALERSRALSHDQVDRAELKRRFEGLSARERDVLALVTAGLLNKQVATNLGLAERTVKHHRKRLMEKMGAESLAELVKLAERIGAAEQSPRSLANIGSSVGGL